MSVLVDSSVWIGFFRGVEEPARTLDALLSEDRVLVNELILCELVPALRLRNERTLISLLRDVRKIPLRIDWKKVESHQFLCMRNGINGVGIPDLIIAQNAMEAEVSLLSLDKHFRLMETCLPLRCHSVE